MKNKLHLDVCKRILMQEHRVFVISKNNFYLTPAKIVASSVTGYESQVTFRSINIHL